MLKRVKGTLTAHPLWWTLISIKPRTVRGRYSAAMYRLEVLFPDEPEARHTEEIEHASDVLARISVLLENHAGCDQIMV